MVPSAEYRVLDGVIKKNVGGLVHWEGEGLFASDGGQMDGEKKKWWGLGLKFKWWGWYLSDSRLDINKSIFGDIFDKNTFHNFFGYKYF